MSKELTVERMISFNGRDGEYVPFDTISDEQKALFREKVGERLSVVAGEVIMRLSREERNDSKDI